MTDTDTSAAATSKVDGKRRQAALQLITELTAAVGDEEAVIDVLRPRHERRDFDDLVLSTLIICFAECMTPASETEPTDRYYL